MRMNKGSDGMTDPRRKAARECYRSNSRQLSVTGRREESVPAPPSRWSSAAAVDLAQEKTAPVFKSPRIWEPESCVRRGHLPGPRSVGRLLCFARNHLAVGQNHVRDQVIIAQITLVAPSANFLRP
jgi:hypothetical protein